MCGIAGYLGHFDSVLLSPMIQRIAHRGPDYQGIWVSDDEKIGFAHARLSIIDLSERSNQPLWDVTEQFCIIFNGEIYNYRELRAELIAKGYQFRSDGDGEVIINLYREFGVECLSRLNGIFAFALWDARLKKAFIARDHFGVKPLYFYHDNRGLLFASEVKAILEMPDVDRQINIDGLGLALSYLWFPSPHTPLQKMQKLQGGHYLLADSSGEYSLHQYYDWPQYAPRDMSVAEAMDGLEHHLQQAVSRQMVADVQVGSFLSGGLDSSAIVSMAKPLAKDGGLPCFTIAYAETAGSEGMQEDLPYARRVAEHCRVSLTEIFISPDIVNDLQFMVSQQDEPRADPAPLNVWYISKVAQQQGIKVLLSGTAGDDLLTGYRRHYAVQSEKLWSWLPHIGRKGLQQLTSLLPKDNPGLRRIAKAFEYADLDPNERLVSYFNWLSPNGVIELFHKDFRQLVRESIANTPLLQTVKNLPDDMEPLAKMLMLEQKYFLTDHNLTYTDKMSMACGVEVRVPFLDRDLVEYAATIPLKYKQHGAEGKWIFKKSMEKYLPYDVIYRPKTGFGMPIRDWMNGELGKFARDILSEQSVKSRGLFDADAIQRLFKLDAQGKVDGAYAILSLVCIELWLRKVTGFTSLSANGGNEYV